MRVCHSRKKKKKEKEKEPNPKQNKGNLTNCCVAFFPNVEKWQIKKKKKKCVGNICKVMFNHTGPNKGSRRCCEERASILRTARGASWSHLGQSSIPGMLAASRTRPEMRAHAPGAGKERQSNSLSLQPRSRLPGKGGGGGGREPGDKGFPAHNQGFVLFVRCAAPPPAPRDPGRCWRGEPERRAARTIKASGNAPGGLNKSSVALWRGS